VDTRDRTPTCGFCDGTGLWVDPEADPASTDPCPLCDGAGVVALAQAGGDEAQVVETVTLTRLLALLPRLSQADLQRLYEELHARYDCRIYRR
jgi:hypothetical protein